MAISQSSIQFLFQKCHPFLLQSTNYSTLQWAIRIRTRMTTDMSHSPDQNPPAYGSPYPENGPPPYYFSPPLGRYGNPYMTAPERLPVKTSTSVFCETCKEQVWTLVRRTRGGLERNGLTDTLFNTVAVIVVSYETMYKHSCPCCGRAFKIYRLASHRAKRDFRRPDAAQPAWELVVDGRRHEVSSIARLPQETFRQSGP